MDILSHALSGLAVSTVVASQINSSLLTQIKICLAGTFAAVIPDFDVISLWSKFDGTIGKWFSLNHSGNEIYFAKFWYSHHAFLHSAVAGVVVSLMFVAFIKFITRNASFKLLMACFTASFFSFVAHLMGDMPTPASVWGGVNFWFPSHQYLGGFGSIWWWNNYDIFLILLAIALFNLILIIINNYKSIRINIVSVILFGLGLIWIIIQIQTRKYDFGYSGHSSKYYELEAKSKEIQREILGEKMYSIMKDFDNHLPIHF